MKNYRFLNCSTNYENYNICLKTNTFEFSSKVGSPGDIVYLAFKINKTAYCGARGELKELTNTKPWAEREKYTQVWVVNNIEYCEPFPIREILSIYLGKHWGPLALQGAKSIKSPQAIEEINQVFNLNKLEKPKYIQ